MVVSKVLNKSKERGSFLSSWLIVSIRRWDTGKRTDAEEKYFEKACQISVFGNPNRLKINLRKRLLHGLVMIVS